MAVRCSVNNEKYTDAISRRLEDARGLWPTGTARPSIFYIPPCTLLRVHPFTHNRIHPFNFLSIVIARILQLQETRLPSAATSSIPGECRLRVDIRLDCFVSRSCGILAMTKVIKTQSVKRVTRRLLITIWLSWIAHPNIMKGADLFLIFPL